MQCDVKQAVNRPVGATTTIGILKIEARGLGPKGPGLFFGEAIESRAESRAKMAE